MNKPSISSLILFLLPALLALTILGFVNGLTIHGFITEHEHHQKQIQQNADELKETLSFIQETGRIQLQLEDIIEDGLLQTKTPAELYTSHTQAVDKLESLNQKLAHLETMLRNSNTSPDLTPQLHEGFGRFKNYYLMATDMVAIDPATANTYGNLAQQEYFEFNRYALELSNHQSNTAEQILHTSDSTLQSSISFIYSMFAIATVLALLLAFYSAHKLSQYLREILTSLSSLTRNQKDIPALPALENLVKTSHGEIKHLGNAVLTFRASLIQNQLEQEKIYNLAFVDNLTSLLNRTSLIHTLTQQLPELIAHQRQNILIKLNINRFKLFNDGMGYDFGDQLLQSLAARISEFDNPKLHCFRTGGDEFAMILEPKNSLAPEALDQLLERLQNHISLALDINGHLIEITTNLGVSHYPISANDTATDCLRRSMIAMHKSKDLGQRKTVIFDEILLTIASEQYEIEKDLARAIDNNELQFYLQTQVHPTHKTQFAECLVRWQHPIKGLISPVAFIKIAEKSDLIVQIDRWMLRQACLFINEQTRLGKLIHISVNISARHFTRPDFIEGIEKILTETAADARKLTLEITESILVNDLDAIVETMSTLQKHGFQFSLDDFGTGYSSLAYLRKLPVQELKIDKTFIDDLESNAEDFQLVSAIFEVAKTFGLSVVVEGVETQNQLSILHKIGAPIIQGYIFSKPIPSADWAATNLVEPLRY